MGKRLKALPGHVEVVQTCRDGSSPVNQEIVTLGDGPPLDDGAAGGSTAVVSEGTDTTRKPEGHTPTSA